jgi:hypothetical protein
MALDAGIAGVHVIRACQVLKVRARRACHLFTAWSAAPFAAHNSTP